MSIPTALRNRTLDVLSRHYSLHGAPQMRIDPSAARRGAWVRYARCGQWQPDAPDPEIFYRTHADDPGTYAAQEYCADCPVRLYCQDTADKAGLVGVWGGVYRDDHRQVAIMCSHPGCLRYRAPGAGALCGWHYDLRASLKANPTPTARPVPAAAAA